MTHNSITYLPLTITAEPDLVTKAVEMLRLEDYKILGFASAVAADLLALPQASDVPPAAAAAIQDRTGGHGSGPLAASFDPWTGMRRFGFVGDIIEPTKAMEALSTSLEEAKTLLGVSGAIESKTSSENKSSETDNKSDDVSLVPFSVSQTYLARSAALKDQCDAFALPSSTTERASLAACNAFVKKTREALKSSSSQSGSSSAASSLTKPDSSSSPPSSSISSLSSNAPVNPSLLPFSSDPHVSYRPSFETLATFPIQALRDVPNFTVAHELYGEIEWLEPVDVVSVDVASVVFFARNVIDVNVGASSASKKLNRKARMRIFNCWPKAPASVLKQKPCPAGPPDEYLSDAKLRQDRHLMAVSRDHATAESLAAFEKKLRTQTQLDGGHFESYDTKTGVWSFVVDSFDSSPSPN